MKFSIDLGNNLVLFNVNWYTSGTNTIGIVSVYDFLTEETKYYVGVSKGLSEEDDAIEIAVMGAKFYPEVFKE